MTVKIRKVGNSRVVTVPRNISVNTKIHYDVFKGRDGALVYLPHRRNPFKNLKYVKEHSYNGDNTGFIDMDDVHKRK